jgi:hypothetical protein
MIKAAIDFGDFINLENGLNTITKSYKFVNPFAEFNWTETLELVKRTEKDRFKYKLTQGGVNGNDPSKQIQYVTEKTVSFDTFIKVVREFEAYGYNHELTSENRPVMAPVKLLPRD